MFKGFSIRCFCIGCVFLLFGALVYAIDYPLNTLYFFSNNDLLSDSLDLLPKPIRFSLPSFIHVVSFSMFSLCIVGNKNNNIYIYPFLWGFINLLFEVIQTDLISHHAGKLLNDMSRENTLFKVLNTFMTNGVFDFGDIVACILGVIVSVAICFSLLSKEVGNEQECCTV